ncbi:unnamed protein product [Moneuplotes crassus]|uniref:SANT and BTB domain-containing protein n=1 Tax=Euplotes crassus TaxID=5936 RepID=A0AAD1XM29_EUPCR|nr:unnamed protein product [Moneuplotes crassus]
MSDPYNCVNQQKLSFQANRFSSPSNDRSRGNVKERANPITTNSAKYTTSSLTSSFGPNRRLIAQRSDKAYETSASKPKKSLYSNLILNGNSMNQNKKSYVPNQTFTRMNGSDQDYSRDSIISDNDILTSKLGSNNQQNLKIIDASKTHSEGGFFQSVGKKINKVVSNSSSKPKINSQFFGQRNSKNVKYKQESINQQRWHPNQKNFTKTKLNKRAEREQSSDLKKKKPKPNNNDSIAQGAYSAAQQISKNKCRSYVFKDSSQKNEQGVFVRNSRASTTYGSGSNRTNTSAGLKRSTNNTLVNTNHSETRKIALSNIERTDIGNTGIKDPNNIIKEINSRRMSTEKLGKEFIRTIAKNNSKALKSQYGETESIDNRIMNTFPTTQTCFDFTKEKKSNGTNIVNNALLQNQKISSSTSNLDKDKNRREEKFLHESSISKSDNPKIEKKQVWSSIGPKITAKSITDQLHTNPKTPEIDKDRGKITDAKLWSVQNSTSNIKSSSTEASIKDLITIHVIDPVTRVKKEFKCNKYILQDEMKCFTKYIKSLEKDRNGKKKDLEIKGIDDLEITVHCQIHIFKWLMDYLNDPKGTFKLNFKNIHSILMSSDYLEMPKLADMCLEYIVDNIKHLLLQKDPIPTYKSHIAKNIARKFCEKQMDAYLDSLTDEKDMILSRLFKKKLELYFEDSRNMLFKCKLCNELYTEAQREVFNCPSNSNLSIGHRGELKSLHMADNLWDLNEFVMQHRENRMQWKEIYWKMWARTKIFKCTHCDKYFRPIDMKKSCAFHLEKFKYLYGENKGTYGCCQYEVKQFGIGITIDEVNTPNNNNQMGSNTPSIPPIKDHRNNGCQTRDHETNLKIPNYLSPGSDSKRDSHKDWNLISFKEDLEHFNRNKDLILKESKIPDVCSIAKLSNANLEDNFEELDDIFIEFKSRYVIEKSKQMFSGKMIKCEESQSNSCNVKKLKNKKYNWRIDALRDDDRYFMSNLMKQIKSKRQ